MTDELRFGDVLRRLASLEAKFLKLKIQHDDLTVMARKWYDEAKLMRGTVPGPVDPQEIEDDGPGFYRSASPAPAGEPCPECGGIGQDGHSVFCLNRPAWKMPEPAPAGEPCPGCHGTGFRHYDHAGRFPCDICEGAPAGETLDEYALESADGSEQMMVHKWIYDHVRETEAQVAALQAKNAKLTAWHQDAMGERDAYMKSYDDACKERESLRARVVELEAGMRWVWTKLEDHPHAEWDEGIVRDAIDHLSEFVHLEVKP